MSQRCLAVALLLGAACWAQTSKPWTPPRNANGQPDLEGIWNTATLTPLQRPAEFAGKPFLTEAEVAAYEQRMAVQNNRDRRDSSPQADVGGAYNDFWFERGSRVVPSRRTSLITDPADGRIPPLTPEAQRKAAERAEYRRLHAADGAEDLGLPVRCLLWPTAGPPMLPGGYNNNYQIVQGPGYVMIIVEMIHDARIIPTDGRPHLPKHVRQWMGDSRGRWEGTTLVVETTNFNDKVAYRNSTDQLVMTERFTPLGPDTLEWSVTFNDPQTWATTTVSCFGMLLIPRWTSGSSNGARSARP